MTVAELRRACAQANPDAEVLVRLDDEALEHPRGLVFEVLSSDYSPGCTEVYALMLDCGQPESEPDEGSAPLTASELKQAASDIDWQQVVLNGGPPCFFIEGSRFCLRAERWGGHGSFHSYVSLAELLAGAK